MEHVRSHILVVEDDADSRNSLVDRLDAKGYAAQGIARPCAGRSASLLPLPLHTMADPAIVFLSLASPDPPDHPTQAPDSASASSYQFIKDLGSPPVVVISADGHLRRSAAAMGAIGWLGKPVRFEVMMEFVELYCDDRMQTRSGPLAHRRDVTIDPKPLPAHRDRRFNPAGRCVLVVEDDEDIGDAVVALLQTERYHAMRARSGREALVMMARSGAGTMPFPDAILLDLALPDISGGEIVQCLHDRVLPVPPVIVMSALPREEVQQQATSMRATAVLGKPFLADTLVGLLSAVIAFDLPS